MKSLLELLNFAQALTFGQLHLQKKLPQFFQNGSLKLLHLNLLFPATRAGGKPISAPRRLSIVNYDSSVALAHRDIVDLEYGGLVAAVRVVWMV